MGRKTICLVTQDQLNSLEATYYHINRGGDITYHGPGQLVGYLIIDLENFFTDIHKYMRFLEEAVIQTLAEFESSGRTDWRTHWCLDTTRKKPRKICALGVKTSRWITMHGLALNVHPNLSYFDHIVPCGINDKAVTSLQAEVGGVVEISEVQKILQNKITVFLK